MTSISVTTWMGDHEGRPRAVNLCPFVGLELNLWPTVYIAVIVLTRIWSDSNKAIKNGITTWNVLICCLSEDVTARHGRITSGWVATHRKTRSVNRQHNTWMMMIKWKQHYISVSKMYEPQHIRQIEYIKAKWSETNIQLHTVNLMQI